ncbi:hypothetical protein P175DRAFT_0529504 [Aspergillus ochraceoroseus IBT 24754]|uniref:AHC1-like C2H2 zinc-finger domain-containing protein n=1 Tax=Aspergillus ochraceoroseus IBT 24754 TaxID=1392256 RepID=A0A2T5M1P9_9EURO|nr:uncharacterized protein P175DRAFT_0529504 [Aspergillus ochraceoroseus IBT 24754]PTU22448.1 hypothetical protein P175DRAFT_0529504 [Aspergillus ochraceoroseus IBT 24754]
MAEELKMLATSPHCATPPVNAFTLPQLKRKRSDSNDSATGRDVPVATKLRTDDAPAPIVTLKQRPSTTETHAHNLSPAPLPDPSSDNKSSQSPPSPENRRSGPSDHARDKPDARERKVDVDRLRETLEAQLSLEVLLKHNELRLIDQEIAKCQVALEQLRRCAEIPYPGSCVTGPLQSVSNGTGASVWAPGNGPAPLSPAPWSVTDGPYSRHYARWLLQDSRFDGGDPEPGTPMAVAGTPVVEGRSTRGNPIDLGYLAGKSTRPQRGSAGAKLQSLPTGYPPPKERAGPMIIRRKSDGIFVKLVCLDCRRDNFSSTQGFINHCRIAHNRNFASHDAAAMASGEPVEVDEAGAVVGGKPEPPAGVAPGFVHPLIRSAHVIESTTPRTPPLSSASSASEISKRPSPSRNASSTVETPRLLSAQSLRDGQNTPVTAKASNDAFMASVDTPHLSSLMKLRGVVGLDLGQLVGEAKTTVDLNGYSSEEGESDTESMSPSVTLKLKSKPLGSHVGRQPMRTTASQTASQRPDGHKGPDKINHKPLSLETLTPTRPTMPYQSPYGPVSSHPEELREVDGMDHVSNMSPNTVESNQAPSLVSDDDDDYEAASDSDSPGPSSSEAEDAEDDFSHIDVEDDDDTTTSTTASDPNPKAGVGMASAAAPRASPMPKAMRRGSVRKQGQLISSSVVPLDGGREEKRVSFASPGSSPAKGKKDGSGRR